MNTKLTAEQVQVIMAERSPLQSRWGWHTCDYTTYCQLRKLHKFFWEQVRDAAASRRWHAKRPENRRGLTKKLCSDVLQKEKRQQWEQCLIRQLFKQARVANPGPVPTLDKDTLNKINALSEAMGRFEAERLVSTPNSR